MRRVLKLVLCFMLILSFAPSVGFAYGKTELTSFLEKEKISEEQLSNHLSRFWGLSIEDFETIEELDGFLGEKITSQNLTKLLASYELGSESELVELLVENDEMDPSDQIRDVFIYIDALDMTVDFYTGTAITDETFQQLLADYGLTLEELTALFADNGDSIDNYKFIEELEDMLYVYGLPLNDQTLQRLLDDYGLTLAELNQILAINEDSLENYNSIADLEISLMNYEMPITEQNLQDLLEGYELTREQLDALLAKYDDSLNNYEMIDDLYFTVIVYMVLDEESNELLDDLGIGLDKQELVRLVKHFLTLDFLDPAFMENLTQMEERLASLGDFDSADDLTAEQMNELINLYDELMNLFGLNAKYYLVKGSDRIALTEEEALRLENTNGYDLLIELYNQEGVFLADIILTADLFGSDLLDNIGDKLDVIKTVPKENGANKEVVKTVNGGKLPNTAGNYTEGLLAGLALIAIGGFWFRRRTVKHS